MSFPALSFPYKCAASPDLTVRHAPVTVCDMTDFTVRLAPIYAVEPVFANICVHKRMHRFTLRTKLKVDVQWTLFALVHNIGKIHTFGAIH